jgi:kinetochore protein Nuf2
MIQMAQHLKKTETELNALLSEYWKLRHETGNLACILRVLRGLMYFSAVYMEIMSNKLTEPYPFSTLARNMP